MSLLEVIFLVVLLLVLIVQVAGLLRQKTTDITPHLLQLRADLERHQMQISERTERELRSQVQETAQGTRVELGSNLAQFQRTLAAQLTGIASLQNSYGGSGFRPRQLQLTLRLEW